MAAVNAKRRQAKPPEFSESAIRRVLRGGAYHRVKVEHRGRPKRGTKKITKAFGAARTKVSEKSNGEARDVQDDHEPRKGMPRGSPGPRI